MNKKYVKTETLTVTRTEEVSVIDESTLELQLPKKQVFLLIWQLLKKWILTFKWIGVKDNG
jgi:hypothetical protein